GPAFADGYPVLAVLSAGAGVGATLGIISGFLLTMTGHEQAASRMVVGTAVLNLALTFVLTPTFGIVGAAVATVVAGLGRVWLLPTGGAPGHRRRLGGGVRRVRRRQPRAAGLSPVAGRALRRSRATGRLGRRRRGARRPGSSPTARAAAERRAVLAGRQHARYPWRAARTQWHGAGGDDAELGEDARARSAARRGSGPCVVQPDGPARGSRGRHAA